ncbi:MAG: ABC transporter ATP-binding protein [Candidatus Microsaccharimonas sp.]
MNNKPTAILVKDIYKSFKLPHERHTNIKQVFIALLRAKRDKKFETQKVLHDISFEIKEGDFFGIVGRNGSGKSTLLKLLAGIYSPDKGLIQVNGSLTPFIELGIGFNPELTGRENVFLNGALLGFSRKDMIAMYDDIVSFAELENFMDQKLKNYSSGMQVRLAFSIAIRAKGDILLIDEVLAVGDAAFQQKCFDYFDELKKNKKTVILVTHDMSAVLRFCTKALLIDKGNILHIGKPETVASKYTALNSPKEPEAVDEDTAGGDNPKDEDFTIVVKNKNEKPSTLFTMGEKVTFEIEWAKTSVRNIGVAIIGSSGEYLYATNTDVDNFNIVGQSVQYTLKLDLAPGKYHVMVGLFGISHMEQIRIIDEAAKFTIKSTDAAQTWEGLVKLESKWT